MITVSNKRCGGIEALAGCPVRPSRINLWRSQ
jgi:hypothetical protein